MSKEEEAVSRDGGNEDSAPQQEEENSQPQLAVEDEEDRLNDSPEPKEPEDEDTTYLHDMEESRDARASDSRAKDSSLMTAFRDFFLAAFSDNYHNYQDVSALCLSEIDYGIALLTDNQTPITPYFCRLTVAVEQNSFPDPTA